MTTDCQNSPRPTTPVHKRELLTVEDVRVEYGLGRELVRRLVQRLPHIRAGSKYLVRRLDLDAYLQDASRRNGDLWADVKQAPVSSGLA
jgi:hypothetical protein